MGLKLGGTWHFLKFLFLLGVSVCEGELGPDMAEAASSGWVEVGEAVPVAIKGETGNQLSPTPLWPCPSRVPRAP
jgi:hypothetical protein